MSDNNRKNNDENDNDESPKVAVRGLAIMILLLALFLTLLNILNSTQARQKTLSWFEFTNLVKEGAVEKDKIEVILKGDDYATIQGVMTEMDANGREVPFKIDLQYTEDRQKYLFDNGIDAREKREDRTMRDLLQAIIPFVIVLGILYFLFIRQMKVAGKGAMSFGKSRAKMLTKSKNRLTFDDIAGLEEAREEVTEIIDFLRDPKKFQRLGGRIPKGVLLVGPPGTGKTLLAKAIAGEAEVPFFSISGSDFVEMFVGVGASRVRDMFEQGRKNAPCIIFIDEIDAVGRSRFSGIGGGHDEREQTLNALLVEMDGFDTTDGIIMIAATNRPDVLDTALLRPGRFDRQIHVDLPTLKGRKEILDIHAAKIRMHAEVDLMKVAKGTPGFSGAELANLVNEAALLAARRDANAVKQIDFEEARDKVTMGLERKSRMNDAKELLATSYHECGHAILMALLEHSDPVHKVTVIPRGRSLGSTMQLPEKDVNSYTKKALHAMIVTRMGGRAAEEIVYGEFNTGAAHDLKTASQIARAMVTQYGMCDEIGPQALGHDDEPVFVGRDGGRSREYSESTAQLIDRNVKQILDESYAEAMHILEENRQALDIMAEILVERETLTGEEVNEILKYHRLLSDEERASLTPASDKRMEAEPSYDSPPPSLPGDEDTPPFGPPETSPA